MQKYIHTSDGQLVPSDPYTVEGARFQYTATTKSRFDNQIVYITKGNIEDTQRLRREYPRGRWNEHVYVTTDDGDFFHVHQDKLMLVDDWID